MFFNIFCLVALLSSIISVTISLIMAIKSHKSALSLDGKGFDNSKGQLTPFQIFLVGFSIGTALLFIPIYYTDYFAGDVEIPRIIKTVFLSIHNTIRVFILDGDFDIIQNTVGDPERVNPILGIAYSVYGALIFVAAPVMTASFVLSFFKNASAYIKYTLNRSKEIYYISELNERSLTLAENILSSARKGRMVVFFDIHEMNEEMSSDMIVAAKRLGAVCFHKDITEVNLKPHLKGIKRKFYFISENEDKNVRQALALIKECRSSSVYNTPSSSFYVFSTTVDSEIIIDSADNGNMILRRVNENRNLVINTLMEDKEIFGRYIDRDGKKVISALVIGSGNYGSELTKAMCWCGQLPGYEINIHVIDKDKDAKKRFAAQAPELVKKSGVEKDGEAKYSINFYPGVDVFTTDLTDTLEKIGDISVAFVTLGTDQTNIAVAMRLRSELAKLGIKNNFFSPNIYAVVYGTLKNDTIMENGGLKRFGTENYNIRFIGDIRDRYSLEVVEQGALESIGMQIHMGWNKKQSSGIDLSNLSPEEIEKKKKKEEENKRIYDKYEYYRRASIATAAHIQILDNLEITFPDEESQQINEHARWNAYMRSEGYVYAKEKKDHIARTHPDLDSFDRLDDEKKMLDSISAETREALSIK